MKKTYTQEERAAVNAARARLAEAAKELEANAPANIDRAVQILSQYSRRNVALILAQAAERGREIPAAVAGFHEWRKAGRIVRKGSQGYFIYAPIVAKDDTEDGASPRGFTVRHVFDVADTEPLAEDSPTTLTEAMS
jgi:hypothetical protein